MSWPTVALGEVLDDARAGFASGSSDPDGVFQVRMNNVTRDGQWDLTRKRYVPAPANLERFLVREGDVLFNATNSAELVGKTVLVRRVDEPTAFSNHFLRLRADKARVDAGFLARWLQWQFGRRVFAGMCQRWVGQAAVQRERLLGMKFPLLPLDQQQRSARVLDAAHLLRERRCGWLARLDALTSATFADMFGDLETNPRNWKSGPVADYVKAFVGGRSFAGIDDDRDDAQYWVLRVSAVTSGRLRTDERRPLPDDYDPPPAHLVRHGDLLISRAKTTDLVGAVALVDERTRQDLVLPDKIWRFEWRDPGVTCPEFVWQLFRSPATRREIGRRATGTSGSMKNISAAKLLAIKTIHPPPDEQRRFARVVQGILRARSCGETHLVQLDTLFASLQHRAFIGAG